MVSIDDLYEVIHGLFKDFPKCSLGFDERCFRIVSDTLVTKNLLLIYVYFIYAYSI